LDRVSLSVILTPNLTLTLALFVTLTLTLKEEGAIETKKLFGVRVNSNPNSNYITNPNSTCDPRRRVP
jgi:hypothetical protein